MQEEQEAPKPAKKGLFGAKSEPAPPSMPNEQINAIAARMRVSEEKDAEIRKKLLLIEQNVISNNKKAITEIKSLQTELLDIKRIIQTIEDRIITVIKELRLTAGKEDVDVLRKYIDLWNPVNFVTQEQVLKMIEEKMNKKIDEKPPRYDSPN